MRQIAPLALAALASALMFSSTADALALGNIASQSALGQPLRLVIPVVEAGGEAINSACLRLVNDGASEGAPQLLAARINVDRGASTPRLVVTTAQPVTEPAMRVSVQAGCDSTIRRDYVLLFDPPEMRPTMVTSAHGSEFAQYARSIRPAAAATPRTAPVMASWAPVPAKVSHSPVVAAPASLARTSPEVERITVPAPVASAAAKTPATVPAPAPVTAPRDLVTLVADNGSGGGLITQASAQSLPRVTTSLPRSPVQPTDSGWAGNWLYAGAGFAMIILGLTAFSLRHRVSHAPMWASSAGHGESLNTGIAATDTFAHFAAMVEPATISPRPTQDFPPMEASTVEDASLDTLLGSINEDVIDERVVRDAWKTAASEHAIDLGSDSILKAIEAAEREMHIAPPTAMDKALDEDLFRDLPRRLAGAR
jgi:hypothetical protein